MSGFLMWGSSAVFLQNSMVAAGSSTSFTTCKSHLPMSHLWATYWAANIPANWWSKAKQWMKHLKQSRLVHSLL
jgi:hypothetical protein